METKAPAAAARKPARTPLQGLLRMLVLQAIWAIPFAIFFGTLFGTTLAAYVQAYKMSLIFAYSVGLALWATRHFIEPRLGTDDELDDRGWVIGAWYTGMALFASYVAATIIHFTVQPGFLGGWRAFAVTSMFSLVFVGLFSGISMARVFYLKAVQRARAVEQTRAELAQAELRALRAQIHPHFLFNTLNTIAALIADQPEAAEETTTRLADVFRYTLRASDREHSRFGDELDFLRAVLSIERRRFGDRLRVVEAIEPGLESLLVPSLLLQPLVENAVRHGVSSRLQGGTVTLGARRDGDRLLVTIEDDGPGFEAAAPSRGAGFGLHSVRERLRVAGPPHDLVIESPPGGGTRIRVTLPVTTDSTPPTTSSGGSRS
jgi:two-component sensor histidine kinase